MRLTLIIAEFEMKIGTTPDLQEMFKKRHGHVMQDVEKWFKAIVLKEALKHCNYNQTDTAEMLGINRGTMRKLINNLEIEMPNTPLKNKSVMVCSIEMLERGEFVMVLGKAVRYNGRYYYTDCGLSTSSALNMVNMLRK